MRLWAYGDSRIGFLVKDTLKETPVISLPVRFMEILVKEILKETL